MTISELKKKTNQLIRDHPGDVEYQKNRARSLWAEALDQHPEVLQQIIQDHADQCVWEARTQVNKEVRDTQNSGKMGHTPGSSISRSTTMKAKNRGALAQRFYQWSMQGKVLGDLTLKELEQESTTSNKIEAYWNRHSKFISLVTKELPDQDTPVRMAISEERLQQLWTAASKEKKYSKEKHVTEETSWYDKNERIVVNA